MVSSFFRSHSCFSTDALSFIAHVVVLLLLRFLLPLLDFPLLFFISLCSLTSSVHVYFSSDSAVGPAKDKTAKEIRREERRRQKAAEKEEKRRLKKLAKAQEKAERINDENISSVNSAAGMLTPALLSFVFPNK